MTSNKHSEDPYHAIIRDTLGVAGFLALIITATAGVPALVLLVLSALTH